MTEKEPYRSLYRVWRPQRFADVVNQSYPVQTLRNAILKGEIAHAHLFAGPRGIGKTSIARIFAKAINCPNQREAEPCNTCDVCLRITRGGTLDVIEIDGASNRGIDQIRQLRAEVNFVPAEVRYKVYIIDEVHMLTNEAFNALLKTLEEPPVRVIFVFATTEPHKVPLTVVSRCLAFEFKNLSPELIQHRLEAICKQENIMAAPETLAAIARRARGAMRDALVLLEQLVAYTGGKQIELSDLTELLGLPSDESVQGFLDAMIERDSTRLLAIIDDLAERGKDLEIFVEELIQRSRERLIAELGASATAHSDKVSGWVRLSSELLALKREMTRAWDKRILLEVTALEFCQVPEAPPASPPPDVAATPATAKPKATTSSGERTRARTGAKREPPSATATASRPSTKAPPTAAPVTAAHEVHTSTTAENPWANLLTLAKQERVALHALLAEANPRLEGQLLHIEFDPQYQFHKEQLEKKENMSALSALARRIYGPVELRVSFRSVAETHQPPQKTATEELHEKVQLIRKTLGGEVIE